MDNEMLMFSMWLVSGFIGALIGHFHDRKGAGLLLGLIFGPLGWILMLFNVGSGAIAAIIVTVAIYLSFMWKKEIESRKPAATPAIQKTSVEGTPTPAPSVKPPSRQLPQCVVKLAHKKGLPADSQVEALYKETLASMTLWHFRARIIQHMDDGHLLVELVDWREKDFPRAQYFSVLNHPDFDQTIDRSIINIQGYTVGAYTYTSTDGGNRTITEVDCVDKDIPQEPPKPGAWMHDPNHRSVLDKPRWQY